MEALSTEILRRLIRFNTVNPPGNERAAQEYLAGELRAAGFEVKLLGALDERPNLVARLRADGGAAGDGPALCYLSHVDTVLADPAEWERDPWSGDVVDGCVWGRGAIDMKSQTAAEVAAGLALAREGWRPARGELLIVAVVDEETGGELGAQWITANHPDEVRCDYLINEGAGASFPYDGRRRYGVCCAEKGVFRFTVSTRGTAAHASQPQLGDNALLKLAPLLARLAERQPSFTPTAEPLALLQALLGAPVRDGAAASALAQVRATDPAAALMIEPMLGVTLAPTKARASEKINVIPSSAQIQVDCRVPPGLGAREALAGAREVLGEDGYELAFTERVEGNRSPADSPLMERISAWVAEHDPGAETVPVILPGFSDSRHFRAAFPDCVAYGFFPQREMSIYESAPLMHAPNERIPVADLDFATGFFRDLAQEVLG